MLVPVMSVFFHCTKGKIYYKYTPVFWRIILQIITSYYAMKLAVD